MNLSNVLHPCPHALVPQDRRAFGKDITNVVRGQLGDDPLKKMASRHLPPTALEAPLKEEKGDAILEYQEEILNYMVSFPQKRQLGEAREAGEVSERMRQILVDWLVEVHRSFELKEETLFLAFQYLGEFQSLAAVSKAEYQLVGVACLWLASKYEEIYPPQMRDFVEVTAGAYTRAQLRAMEGRIIEALRFDLNRVTPLALLAALRLESFNNQQNERCLNMAQFVLELSYLSGSIPGRYEVRTMVVAAVKLAENVCGREMNLGFLGEGSEMVGREVWGCHKELCLLLQGEKKHKLTAIRRKYQQEKFNSVGRINVQLRPT